MTLKLNELRLGIQDKEILVGAYFHIPRYPIRDLIHTQVLTGRLQPDSSVYRVLARLEELGLILVDNNAIQLTHQSGLDNISAIEPFLDDLTPNFVIAFNNHKLDEIYLKHQFKQLVRDWEFYVMVSAMRFKPRSARFNKLQQKYGARFIPLANLAALKGQLLFIYMRSYTQIKPHYNYDFDFDSKIDVPVVDPLS